MSETTDYTNVGALPTLDAEPEVLGEPTSKAKSKTNVGKFAILGLVLVGFLFIVAGLLFYQKHKRANATVEAPAKTEPVKPEFAAKNAAVESDSIEKAKAEIKKKEEEEERKRKEANKDDDPDDKYSKLLEKLEALEKANAERDKKAARKATIESVKAGLKDKFDKANLEIKNYFLNAAITKLEIPDEDVDIDDLVAGVLPDRIRVEVADADASPAKGAVVRFYPVRWYTYTVTAEPQAGAATDRRGRCTVPVARIFEPEQEFGVRYCNCLVEAEYGGVKAYGWLPLYELQNARFAGQREHTLRLRLKRGCGLVRTVGIDE